MKIDLKVAGQGDTEYLGELIEQIPEGLLVSCQKELALTDTLPVPYRSPQATSCIVGTRQSSLPLLKRVLMPSKSSLIPDPGSITAVNTPYGSGQCLHH